MEKQFTTYEQSQALINAGMPSPENPISFWNEIEDGSKIYTLEHMPAGVPAYTAFDLLVFIARSPNHMIEWANDLAVIYFYNLMGAETVKHSQGGYIDFLYSICLQILENKETDETNL